MDDNRPASSVGLSEDVRANVERLVRGPHGDTLGLELVDVRSDYAEIRMPYRAELTTERNVVHGGAIATLVDTAATAAVWANNRVSLEGRGATVSMTVNYLLAARADTLFGTAHIRRRGRRISTIEVSVRNCKRIEVAVGLVTYKLSSSV